MTGSAFGPVVDAQHPQDLTDVADEEILNLIRALLPGLPR